LAVNDNKTVYESAEEHLNTLESMGEELDANMRQKIIELDSLVEIWLFSRTPAGHFKMNCVEK
jgi:hypothetical protein